MSAQEPDNEETCGLSRRSMLGRGAAVGMAALAAPTVLPTYAFAAPAAGTRGANDRPPGTLVVLFMRGAVDGLSVVVPHGDKAYYDNRPTISIPAHQVHDLDGHFGLHPSMGALMPLWHNRDLAIVQATGLTNTADYSHFDAQAEMESGANDPAIGTGWLARHLLCRPQAQGTLRAVSYGAHVAASLVGWGKTTALDSIDSFGLDTLGQSYDRVMHALDRLYSDSGRPATQAAHDTFDALARVSAVRKRPYKPAHHAKYPTSVLGNSLLDIARVIKEVGQVEAVTVDAGGWDTHAAQSAVLPTLLGDLASSLHAFTTDLGEHMNRTTIVVMSEFGRRLEENSAQGTDHGHGNMMFVLGRGIRGGRVYGSWPGLAARDLDLGNLAVTTDYRRVLADVVEHRLDNHHLARVFPGMAKGPLDIVKA